MTRMPEWMKKEHAWMQRAFERDDVAKHTAEDVLDALPAEMREPVRWAAADLAEKRITIADTEGVPLVVPAAVLCIASAIVMREIERRDREAAS